MKEGEVLTHIQARPLRRTVSLTIRKSLNPKPAGDVGRQDRLADQEILCA
jgi:hypothetical protein